MILPTDYISILFNDQTISRIPTKKLLSLMTNRIILERNDVVPFIQCRCIKLLIWWRLILGVELIYFSNLLIYICVL